MITTLKFNVDYNLNSLNLRSSHKSHARKCMKPIKENLAIDPECLLLYCFFFFFQATAEANNLAALASSKDSYTKSMEHVSYSHIIRVIRQNTVKLS